MTPQETLQQAKLLNQRVRVVLNDRTIPECRVDDVDGSTAHVSQNVYGGNPDRCTVHIPHVVSVTVL